MTVQNIVALVTVVLAIATTVAALRKGSNENRRTDLANLVDRVSKLERKARLLDDYSNALRNKLRQAGLEVPDWPEELTEGGV